MLGLVRFCTEGELIFLHGVLDDNTGAAQCLSQSQEQLHWFQCSHCMSNTMHHFELHSFKLGFQTGLAQE